MAVIVASSFMTGTATAQTDIHRCTDADGGIVYSQLPCELPKPVEPTETEQVENTEATDPASINDVMPAEETPQESFEFAEDVAACQKRFRDAIDAIDAEIGRDFTPEKGEQYKNRLLALTRQLRNC